MYIILDNFQEYAFFHPILYFTLTFLTIAYQKIKDKPPRGIILSELLFFLKSFHICHRKNGYSTRIAVLESNAFLMIHYKIANGFVKLLRFFPEKHMSGIFKKYSLRTFNILSYPCTSMPVKNITVSCHTYKGWKLNLRDKISLVQIGMVTHDFNSYIWRTFGNLISDKFGIFRCRSMMKAGTNQSFR